MIGNDIIDLNAIQERSPLHWQRYREKTMTVAEQEVLSVVGTTYDERCQHNERCKLRRTAYDLQTMKRHAEQALITSFPETNLDIWLAWSVKESVYKLEFQLEQQRYFAPKSIQILSFDSNLFTGIAQGKLGCYSFEIHLQKSFLHALAWPAEQAKPSFQCLPLDAIPLHTHLVAALNLHFPKEQLRYERWPFPRVISSTETIIPVSMSHDGAWGAFAYSNSYLSTAPTPQASEQNRENNPSHSQSHPHRRSARL